MSVPQRKNPILHTQCTDYQLEAVSSTLPDLVHTTQKEAEQDNMDYTNLWCIVTSMCFASHEVMRNKTTSIASRGASHGLIQEMWSDSWMRNS